MDWRFPRMKTLYIAVSDPKKAVWMAYDVKTMARSPTGGFLCCD
jgi:hypothetical protein